MMHAALPLTLLALAAFANAQDPKTATIQLPEQASTLAPAVDSLYYDTYWISVAFFVAIVGAVYLASK